MLIDAHQHFWAPARGDYGWLTPDLTPLHRDFLPADLAPLLADAGIAGTVLVQAAPTLTETRWLLALADATPFVRAVVGWVDFTAADAVATLEGLAAHPKFRGVRPMLQDIADPDWVLNPAFGPVFDALIRLDLRFDALVTPRHLPMLRRLLDRHPDLRAVVDHGGKPGIAAGDWRPWADDIAAIAADGRACAKLSGLLTEAIGAPMDAMTRYADHLLRCFTPERLLWGSDWPVLRLAGDHAGWLDWSRAWARPLGDAANAAIFGGAAAAFYRIGGQA